MNGRDLWTVPVLGRLVRRRQTLPVRLTNGGWRRIQIGYVPSLSICNEDHLALEARVGCHSRLVIASERRLPLSVRTSVPTAPRQANPCQTLPYR